MKNANESSIDSKSSQQDINRQNKNNIERMEDKQQNTKNIEKMKDKQQNTNKQTKITILKWNLIYDKLYSIMILELLQ